MKEITVPLARYEELVKKEQALETVKLCAEKDRYLNREDLVLMLEVKPIKQAEVETEDNF